MGMKEMIINIRSFEFEQILLTSNKKKCMEEYGEFGW